MRQSQLFTKTEKQAPKDEVTANAQLLVRGGFVHKEMAGVYSYLPLGLRVLKKIERIIREEMNAVGGQELLLTTLQDPKIWQQTNRWSKEVMDVWFKTELAAGGELGVANTHEEPLTNLMKQHIRSYKDLPVYAYQIQNKFRNELRAKSGLMRGREFLMKDLYSFVRSREDLDAFHEECADAYMRIFNRCGIGEQTYRTFASGGAFSKFSDEFQTLSKAGEDVIYLDRDKGVAVNKEVYTDEVLGELGLEKGRLAEEKAIEVGNIFKLGTRFSEPLELTYKDEEGNEQPVVMGSYGIGLGRLMATVVEVLHDGAGIVWPSSIAPFDVHLLELPGGSGQDVYEKLQSQDIEVLYDDRDASPGQKLGDADLLGIPYRVVASKKTGEKLEVKKRIEKESKLMGADELIKFLNGNH